MLGSVLSLSDMKTCLWLIIVSAMFFSGCSDDTDLPPSEMGKTKEKNTDSSQKGTGGNDPAAPVQPKPSEQSQLPTGKPAEQLVDRKGVHFFGDETAPYTGVVEKRHENGTLSFWANYSNGQPDGLQYFWDEKGQKLQQASFTQGALDGSHTYWWPNGIKKEERVWDQGKQRELRRWSKTGELIEEKKNF